MQYPILLNVFSLIPALGSPNGRAFAPRGSRGSRGSRQSASLVGKSSINWAFEWEMHTVDGCEILHHLGWKPINNGINHVSTCFNWCKISSIHSSWILHGHVYQRVQSRSLVSVWVDGNIDTTPQVTQIEKPKPKPVHCCIPIQPYLPSPAIHQPLSSPSFFFAGLMPLRNSKRTRNFNHPNPSTVAQIIPWISIQNHSAGYSTSPLIYLNIQYKK